VVGRLKPELLAWIQAQDEIKKARSAQRARNRWTRSPWSVSAH
jgi:hypothetical protein